MRHAQDLWDDYRRLRIEAERQRLRADHTQAALALLRTEVADWIAAEDVLRPHSPDAVDRRSVEARIGGLVTRLRRFPEFVSDAELAATERFVEFVFACHRHTPSSLVAPGRTGFAFLVQMRLSADSLDYADELVPLVPAMHYVPARLREPMMFGVPPYVADTYEVDGQPGHLIVTPVFAADAVGVDRSTFIRRARARTQDGIDLARRLGARVIGLGGVLPSLTRYGQAVDARGGVLTTGHAGTIRLVAANVDRAVDRVGPSSTPVIGVLGLGSIGQSIALWLTRRYGGEIAVIACDRDSAARQRFFNRATATAGGGIAVTTSSDDLIARANVIVSAVTDRIDLGDHPGDPSSRLVGTHIIDDSQPFSFSPRQVVGQGGTVTWVIADTERNIRRHWYHYGTMADRHDHFFGCEVEAAVLTAEHHRLLAAGVAPDAALSRLRATAVRRAATLDDVATIGALFDAHGVGIAPPQTFAVAPAHRAEEPRPGRFDGIPAPDGGRRT
ncbi:MAG: hypothetical protein AAGD35_01385 [Actinomycetota bacterium]